MWHISYFFSFCYTQIQVYCIWISAIPKLVSYSVIHRNTIKVVWSLHKHFPSPLPGKIPHLQALSLWENFTGCMYYMHCMYLIRISVIYTSSIYLLYIPRPHICYIYLIRISVIYPSSAYLLYIPYLHICFISIC